MITGIAVAFTASAILLMVLNRFNLPSIPVYLFAGFITGITIELYRIIAQQDLILLEDALVQDLIFIGLGFLVFISISQVVLDKNRKTSLNSFKAGVFVAAISLLFGFGTSLYFGLNITEAFLIGFAAAFGSSLANFDFVGSKARENHIYGWLIEDLNLYQDILSVLTALSFVIIFSEAIPVISIFAVVAVILGSLLMRKVFNTIYLRYEFGNELIMLFGVTMFIGLTLLTEQLGLTALAGILAAGLIFVDTELGFQVHERLASLRDFFAALSFFAIGLLLTNFTLTAFVIAALLTVYVSVFRPLILIVVLGLQGYDLRTSYLTAIGNSEVSEITILAALLLLETMVLQTISSEVFAGVTIAFAVTMVISHSLERKGPIIFEKYLSDYEFDPERQNLPLDLSGHVILAGFDDRTQGLVGKIAERDVVAIDYSLERIEEADELNVFHILGDLTSMQTWELADYQNADIIVSAVSDSDTISKIEELDTSAHIITVNTELDSSEINKRIREMLNDELR